MKNQRKEQKHIPEVQAGSKREKLVSSLWQKSTVFPNVPDSSASVRLPFPPRLPFLSCESTHIADRHWSQALAQIKCESYLGSLICLFPDVVTYHKCLSFKRHIRAASSVYTQGNMERRI